MKERKETKKYQKFLRNTWSRLLSTVIQCEFVYIMIMIIFDNKHNIYLISAFWHSSFPWCKLQPLIKLKLEIVMNELNEKFPTHNLPHLPNVEPFNFDYLKSQILESIESFSSAPFTIQRICEMITNPNKHYKRTDKFMRAIEKNVRVVSTIEPHEFRYFNSFTFSLTLF